MGGFYGSVHVKGADRVQVRSALEELARKKKKRFLLGPFLNGWIGVYPDGGGQDLAVVRDLAKRLTGEVVGMVVHDDDVFAYEFYSAGKRVDRYNSIPDYFGEVSEKEKRSLRGRPELLAHLASDPARFAAIRARLAESSAQGSPFASDLMREFAEALGIRNAVTSYEYLKDYEETDDIEGWEQFLHVPDLSQEVARQRKVDAAILDQKQRLIAQGLLLAERASPKGFAGPWPWCCPAPDGRGFLVAWSSHADQSESMLPLERHGPPWSAGPKATDWVIQPHVYGMALSPSGRYLAVAHAAGDWKATLYDLHENRMLSETPQVHAVSCVGFLPDESAMYSVSSQGEEGRVILSPIKGGDPQVLELAGAHVAAAHPAGSWLVVAHPPGRLSVLDIASGGVVKTLLVGGRYSSTPLDHLAAAHVSAELSKINFEEVQQRMKAQLESILRQLPKTGLPPGIDSAEHLKEKMERQCDEQLQRMKEQFDRPGGPLGQGVQDRGAEGVSHVLFHPTGELLILATSGGIRAYPWADVLRADGDLPRPALAFDFVETLIDTGHGSTVSNVRVYDIEFDPRANRLLFAGLDGRLRSFDLGSGQSGVVLEPPALLPIINLALSRDCQTLALRSRLEMFGRSRTSGGCLLQFWSDQAIRGQTPTA